MTHPSITSLLRYFEYQHLPERLSVVSEQFYVLAHQLADTQTHGPELSVALRKLLEAKDCAVRNALEGVVLA